MHNNITTEQSQAGCCAAGGSADATTFGRLQQGEPAEAWPVPQRIAAPPATPPTLHTPWAGGKGRLGFARSRGVPAYHDVSYVDRPFGVLADFPSYWWIAVAIVGTRASGYMSLAVVNVCAG